MKRTMAGGELVRHEDLPPADAFGPGAVLLYDRRLGALPRFRPWVHSFRRRLALPAGEAAKAVTIFPVLAARLVARAAALGREELRLVALGGGATADAAGFLASVLRRGVSWECVPTTWLSALDSAHGGKTALNAGGVKNALGTFHPAARVHLVRAVLLAQPEERAREGAAELVKAACLDGGSWAAALLRTRARGGELLWRFLFPAIAAKLRIVARDPREKRGPRRLLNLGHTVGHVLEAAYGLSHGEAVAQGLHFALRWSVARAGLPPARARAVGELLARLAFPYQPGHYPPLSAARFRALLAQDKKLLSRGRVDFIFLRDLGRPVRRPVTLGAILAAARREGWVR